MRNRAFRPIATILSLLLAAAVPAQASPVAFADVVQVIGGHAGVQDLRLRTVSQSNSTTDSNNSNASPTAPGTAPSSLTASNGTAARQDSSGGNVETIETGDISGTICDCGEIPVPGGGFPKLPLLALAAVPLAFIHGHKDTPPFEETPFTPTTPTTPTTPQTPIPEPATLLLFGSGLAALSAGARRRYARSKMLIGQNAGSLTEEV